MSVIIGMDHPQMIQVDKDPDGNATETLVMDLMVGCLILAMALVFYLAFRSMLFHPTRGDVLIGQYPMNNIRGQCSIFVCFEL
jgi:hypothetical protein